MGIGTRKYKYWEGDKVDMIKMSGKNNFKDNTYDYWEWSAPILHKPEELKQYIEKFNIIGKEVYDIKVLGHSLYHSTNCPNKKNSY